jgi:hypothetical protein
MHLYLIYGDRKGLSRILQVYAKNKLGWVANTHTDTDTENFCFFVTRIHDGWKHLQKVSTLCPCSASHILIYEDRKGLRPLLIIFTLAPMEVLAHRLRTLDRSLIPPSTQAEIVCVCLKGGRGAFTQSLYTIKLWEDKKKIVTAVREADTNLTLIYPETYYPH